MRWAFSPLQSGSNLSDLEEPACRTPIGTGFGDAQKLIHSSLGPNCSNAFKTVWKSKMRVVCMCDIYLLLGLRLF